MPADVTDSAAMEDAVERFGRIDGWVNSAGVTGLGALLDVPLSDIEQILRVNVMAMLRRPRPELIAGGVIGRGSPCITTSCRGPPRG